MRMSDRMSQRDPLFAVRVMSKYYLEKYSDGYVYDLRLHMHWRAASGQDAGSTIMDRGEN